MKVDEIYTLVCSVSFGAAGRTDCGRPPALGIILWTPTPIQQPIGLHLPIYGLAMDRSTAPPRPSAEPLLYIIYETTRSTNTTGFFP